MVEKEVPLALVTGAAHRLGRAFSLCLGRLGYAILLHFNTSEIDSLETVKEIEALGVPVYPFKADLTKPAEIDGLFSFLDTLPQNLKVLVNSAAIMHRTPIHDLAVDEWDSTMSLNLRAPFLLAQKAALRMKENGLIVNITDAGVSKTWTGYPAYLVSKSGLEALTRILAKTLAPEIRVNAIAPGLVLPAETIEEDQWRRLVERSPLRKPTAVEDVTSVLEFLVTNKSMTGQTIVVDGGYSMG